MKNTLLMTITTTLMLLLSGCGNNTPEEVAKTFAGKLSGAEMGDMKDIVTENVSKKILRLKKICGKNDEKKLYDESVKVLDELERKSKDKKYDSKLKEILSQLKKNTDKFQKKTEKDILAEYGSPKNIPVAKREELMADTLDKLAGIVEPAIDEIFDALDIKTKHPEDIKKIVTVLMTKGSGQMRPTRRNMYVLQKAAQDVVSGKEGIVTPECVARYTEFGYIDEINIIESKQNSPDRADVRLELISEDGKSKKVSVDVEKIKDEWKVASLYLDTFF